ncbi:MAG: TonB-dependent receptor domain-containing protein, partial [Planctomycetota bacterium]
DRLFLTGGLRFDGFSTFGEDYGMAMYPKISVAYNVSEESFWPDWWDGMKLRGAWGESGRAPGAFDALKTWDPVSGDEGRPGVTPATLGNPDLGPERSRELEFGFEAAMFNGRVGFEFTRYQQTTIDALIPVQQIPSLGFIGSQLQNVGELKNSGIESQLNLAVLRGGQVEWDVGLRYGTNHSEVVDLGEIQDIYVGWRQRIRPCSNPDGTPSAEAIAQEAYRGAGNYNCPIPGYWHNVVVNDSATAANPNGFTPAGTEPIMEEQYLGPSYPTDLLGVSFTVRVGRWLTLDAVGEGQFGHFLSSGVAYQNARRGVWPLCRDIQTRWDEADAAGGTAAARAALNAYEKAKCIRGYTSYGMWIQSADFFKLRALSLQFRLPSRLIPGTRSATLQIQARNLFRITSFQGLDPEASEEGGTQEVLLRQEYYNLPPYRSFIAGLRLEF